MRILEFALHVHMEWEGREGTCTIRIVHQQRLGVHIGIHACSSWYISPLAQKWDYGNDGIVPGRK